MKALADPGAVVRHSPPFSRRGGCAVNKRSRSSAAQTGWLVISNRIRSATRASIRRLRDFLLTTPPSASNGLMPRAPLLENGGDWAWPNHLPLSQTVLTEVVECS